MVRPLRFFLILAAALVPVSAAVANNRLADGDFEFGTHVPGWELVESIYDQSSMLPRDAGNVNSAQQQGFGPFSGETALWLRAFVGGQSAGPNALSNATLSQEVPVVGGTTYTFVGHSRWEINYSGGYTTLAPSGPLGDADSPTTDFFELAFLDASGSVIAETELDLRTQQNNFDVWREHSLSLMAPADAVNARVTAKSEAMLWNGGGNESAFYDAFSLKADNDDAELLANADLEDLPGSFNPAWTVTESPGGNIPNDPTVSTRDFANRPDSGGQLGAWLRSFTGNADQPADAVLTQVLPADAGEEYQFSGWARFQQNYSGGDPSFGTQTLMELAFLDASGNPLGAPQSLDLYANGQRNDGVWRQHSIADVAPPGTEQVRVTVAGLGMQNNPLGGQQSAFLDDFELIGPAMDDLNGDFNEDGQWDCLDVDALASAITSGGTVADFDMNGDGELDAADVTGVDGWLAVAGANRPDVTGGQPFLEGDANLDGVVDVSDFNIWNGNKFNNAAWCGGDFSLDGSTDVSDFNVWNANKFRSSTVPSSIPEPTPIAMILGMSLAASACRHRFGPRKRNTKETEHETTHAC